MAKITFTALDGRPSPRRGFVADMHVHTAYSHDCDTPVKEIVALARKRGIWVALTDHNRIGGVLEARKYKDAPVIPGIELCSREGKEVIAYFWDDERLESFYERRIAPYLKEKNALRSSRTPLPLADIIDFLSAEECVIHLPHPFASQPRRIYSYLSRRSSLLAQVHSVEALNGMQTRRANLSSLGWAVSLGKGVAGGSDSHDLNVLGQVVTVSKATTVKEHLRLVANGRVEIIGTELKGRQRVWEYASTTVRTKLTRGVTDGIRKGLSLPGKASRRILDELRVRRMD